MPYVNRRTFLAATGTLAAVGPAIGARRRQVAGHDHTGACVIASGNGLAAVSRAMALMSEGVDPAVAAVRGVNLVEDDPNDMSVGYGGLPNELGVVELDASVMHGPTHKAGAVAALRNIRNPASVALTVLQRTDHVLLVGRGALEFAKAHGFPEQDLLTDRARQAWLKWKENRSPDDDWLDQDQRDWDDKAGVFLDRNDVPFTHGTIHCAAVTAGGDLGAVTTTSGLSYKIPGRVGDSPIIGAGMYVDNDVGAAGATGRGEAVIQNCGAFDVVRHMERGMGPTEACVACLRRIADRTRQKRLMDEHGRPRFNVALYALRKDGAFGAASIYGPVQFAVDVGEGARHHDAAMLFAR